MTVMILLLHTPTHTYTHLYDTFTLYKISKLLHRFRRVYIYK